MLLWGGEGICFYAFPQTNGGGWHRHKIQPITGCGFLKEWTSFSPLPLTHTPRKPVEILGPAKVQKKADVALPLQSTSHEIACFIIGVRAVYVLQLCIVPTGPSASTIKRLCYFWSKVSG